MEPNETTMRLHMNESYELFVPTAGMAHIVAPNAIGALRGMETFSQLLQPGSASSLCDYTIAHTPILIHDAPRFTHRGFLIDTGRHFHSVGSIKRTLEALSWNKLNVLHWHLSEMTSFPLELESAPELAREGSFGPSQTYSKSDVAVVVEHARLLGVRVVPEIDMPGHMGSWARSHPELTIATGPRHHVANYRIANPASSTKLLELVGKVVREAIGLFPDETFFLGGDETACPYNECDYFSAANQSARCPRAYANTPPAKRAGFRCPLSGWMDNDGVRKWSGTFKPPGGQNVSDGHAQIFQWFAEQVEEFVTSAGRTPSWWNDRYDVQTDRTDHALPPASRPIVENWLRHGDQGLTPYLRDGWRVIQGAGWYLPSGPRQQVPNEPDVQDWSYCASPPGVWAEFYAEDPTRNASGASAEQMANLLGGEVSAWGNCIDASDLETKAWPASSAVAERLWSPSRANNLTEAFPRLAAFRCHMVRRGVRAESIHPGSCWSWPATPSIGHRPAPLTSDVKGAQ